MTEDDDGRTSEEFGRFNGALKQIVAVKKIDSVEELPKMFRERKLAKKAARKRATPKR
jgi:hypothetical protein